MLFAALYAAYFLSYLYVGNASGELAGPRRLKPLRVLVTLYGRYRSIEFADVGWYVPLAKEGYPRQQFALTTGQTPLAYFPLMPLAARALYVVFGADPVWTYFFLNAFALFFVLVLADDLLRRVDPGGSETRRLAVLIACLVGLSPIALHPNFVVLPLALTLGQAVCGAMVLLENSPRLAPRLGAAVCTLLLGLSRPQGLLMGAACAVGLVVWRWATGAPSRKLVAAYAGVAATPWVVIPLWYNYLCGEPWAFIKIQSAWGRAFCLPWNNPHLRAFFSERVLGSEWETALLLVRIGLATLFLGLVLVTAFREWRADPSQARRATFISFLSLLAFGQIVMFLSTGSLVGANRLFVLALPVLLFGAARLRPEGQLVFVVLGVILQAAMHTLFNVGHRGFTW